MTATVETTVSKRPRRGPKPQPRPFPMQALEKALRWPGSGRMGMLMGVHPRQVQRWRHNGLTLAQADLAAVRCGFHPSEVWPDW